MVRVFRCSIESCSSKAFTILIYKLHLTVWILRYRYDKQSWLLFFVWWVRFRDILYSIILLLDIDVREHYFFTVKLLRSVCYFLCQHETSYLYLKLLMWKWEACTHAVDKLNITDFSKYQRRSKYKIKKCAYWEMLVYIGVIFRRIR